MKPYRKYTFICIKSIKKVEEAPKGNIFKKKTFFTYFRLSYDKF